MSQETRGRFGELVDAVDQYGPVDFTRRAINKLLVGIGSVKLVHTFVLEDDGVQSPGMESCFTTRFLSPDEVRCFSADPINHLDASFVERAQGGLDLCYGAIHGDRLASYGWYALHSVEPEHAAGAALGLPGDVAYMYKGFTHPDFRGRRLYGVCMGRALEALEERGVQRLLSFVFWSNTPSLRSFELLGYRRLGLMAVGPGGPVRVPESMRRLGVLVGDEAKAVVERRSSAPTGPRAWMARPPSYRTASRPPFETDIRA